MTPQDKKERRQARHEAQAGAKKLVNKRIGLFSTPKQVKSAARILADKYVSYQLSHARS